MYNNTNPRITVTRRISNYGKTKFSTLIKETDWTIVTQSNDTNLAYDKFINILLEIYDTCFPKITISTNNCHKKKHNNPWITNEIKNLLVKRNDLYKGISSKGDDADKAKLRSLRNRINCLIKNTKKDFYQERFLESEDMNSTWKLINDLLGREKKTKRHGLTELEIDGSLITDEKQISNCIGDYYCKAPSLILEGLSQGNTSNDHNEVTDNSISDTFYFQPVKGEEILLIDSKIKKNTAPGWDGLQAKIIKPCLEDLLTPLIHIFNLSIKKAEFPEQMKIAILIPVLKGGDNKKCQNYRPISILSFFAKLLEGLIYNRIQGFIVSHNILSMDQYGFRPGRSADMAIASLCKEISTHLDSGKLGLAIFMDLSKAFDIVNHEILIKKASHYGLRGHMATYLRNYLRNRKFCVKNKSTLSRQFIVNRGVPQGSTLGPLLFLLYINDITKNFYKGKGILYADDATYIEFHEDLATLNASFNKNLKNIYNWFNRNELIVNEEKTKIMIFSTRHNTNTEGHDCKIYLGDAMIDRVTTHKFLGVTIDDRLNWNQHVEEVVKGIARIIGITRKINNLVNTKSLIMLYHSLIYSKILYGLLSWGNTSGKNLDKILILQKRFLRLIEHKGYRESITYSFQKYGILKVQQIVSYIVSVFIYRTLYDKKFAFYNNDWFHHNFEISDEHNLRNRNQLSVPIHNRKIGANSIIVKGAKDWNKLPSSVTGATNVLHFKTSIRDHLLTR